MCKTCPDCCEIARLRQRVAELREQASVEVQDRDYYQLAAEEEATYLLSRERRHRKRWTHSCD